jgi:hypothetical protein
MTTDAAMFGVDCMHGTLEGYTITLLATTQRMAVDATRHTLVVTDSTCVVEVFMAYVREWHRVDLARVEIIGPEQHEVGLTPLQPVR